MMRTAQEVQGGVARLRASAGACPERARWRAGWAIAVALLERRGFTASDFHVFHPGGKLGAMLRTVADLMHKLQM